MLVGRKVVRQILSKSHHFYEEKVHRPSIPHCEILGQVGLSARSGARIRAVSQPYLLGQRNHHMPVVPFGQLLGQTMSQDLDPAIDTEEANLGFAENGTSI